MLVGIARHPVGSWWNMGWFTNGFVASRWGAESGGMVWLLNDVYDIEHRSYFMSEKKMELIPLKIRSHGASTVMQYDERDTPYIEMT
ncbi:mutator protein [Hordeum vulgare]|nr:mutator protein [Hordeum vulgare]